MSANVEMINALEVLEKEKNIPREVIIDKIKETLTIACKNAFGRTDNISISIDPETCEYHIIAAKQVVEVVEDPVVEISLAKAQEYDGHLKVGEVYFEEIKSLDFGRIAASAARNTLINALSKEESKAIYDEYISKQHTVVTGVIQRKMRNSISVNLGNTEAILSDKEQIAEEDYKTGDRYKFYITDVKKNKKDQAKIFVSRTHPELVRCLFEQEVAEIREGIVEIKSIAREAGKRTKMAVLTNDEDVDAVGACVGMNGTRVNAVVEELNDEKIDIINWDENPARLIENALSPAKVISVVADSEDKSAKVIVPDYQLSLAIGREGQNARLAAKLTGYKIDIKSETQARESGDFPGLEDEYYDEEDEYYDDVEFDSDVEEVSEDNE